MLGMQLGGTVLALPVWSSAELGKKAEFKHAIYAILTVHVCEWGKYYRDPQDKFKSKKQSI